MKTHLFQNLNISFTTILRSVRAKFIILLCGSQREFRWTVVSAGWCGVVRLVISCLPLFPQNNKFRISNGKWFTRPIFRPLCIFLSVLHHSFSPFYNMRKNSNDSNGARALCRLYSHVPIQISERLCWRSLSFRLNFSSRKTNPILRKYQSRIKCRNDVRDIFVAVSTTFAIDHSIIMYNCGRSSSVRVYARRHVFAKHYSQLRAYETSNSIYGCVRGEAYGRHVSLLKILYFAR